MGCHLVTRDIAETDRVIKDLFPEDETPMSWMDMAQEFIAFKGLLSRICWFWQEEREKAGFVFNKLVKEGKVKAPLVIGRNRLGTSSETSANR